MVTGAFSHTGKYIARKLLGAGRTVRTLTSHPNRPHEFEDKIAVYPYSFDNPEKLENALHGVDTLYNTYWIRFDYGGLTYEVAVRNTQALIAAAVKAKVRKIVHVSITHASDKSHLRYFRGKGVLEKSIMESGLRYAVLRPTVIFGPEGLLINNIAWLLRRFPVFAIPGSGQYPIQPIFVEDLANLAVTYATSDDNQIVDAVGPEIFTYDNLVRSIRDAVGRSTRLIHLPPWLIWLAAKPLNYWLEDLVLTPEEIIGLMDGLLVSDKSPTGRTRLNDWLIQNKSRLGLGYQSELKIHF